jgi:hypothetical protein
MGGAEMEEPAMADSVERLRGELSDKLELIRRAGGGIVFEEFPGDLEEDALAADGADVGRAAEAREASCVTQRKLIDEANRLAETLERLRRRVDVLRGPLAVITAHDGAAHSSPAGRPLTP